MFTTIALFVLLLIAGIGLVASGIIVVAGLLKRRSRLWGGGLVAGVLSLAALIVAGVGIVREAYQTTRSMLEQASNPASPSVATMQDWFTRSTGLDLPQSTLPADGQVITVGLLDSYYIKIHTAPDFERLLQESFNLTSWDTVQDAMTPLPEAQQALPFWDVSVIQRLPCYRRDFTDASGTTFVVYLAYDRAMQTAYFVGMQTRD